MLLLSTSTLILFAADLNACIARFVVGVISPLIVNVSPNFLCDSAVSSFPLKVSPAIDSACNFLLLPLCLIYLHHLNHLDHS